MSRSYVVAVEGLEQLKNIEELPLKTLIAAHQAINSTLKRTRAEAAREMRRQVNFPASYLTGDNERLKITSFATTSRLEGVITGRRRATSLARFVTNGAPGRRGGVTVKVKPGSPNEMKRAFLMRLRAGTETDLNVKSNLGLAVRTNGEKPPAAYRPVKVGEKLWLLYGPSVDQVFRSVKDDIAPDAADFLEREFLRLMEADL